ncbi:MAG: hypothetical protein HYV96_09315 [Opitutae bacterium]|nr:hypothetical protein [Opitutae bacterium]
MRCRRDGLHVDTLDKGASARGLEIFFRCRAQPFESQACGLVCELPEIDSDNRDLVGHKCENQLLAVILGNAMTAKDEMLPWQKPTLVTRHFDDKRRDLTLGGIAWVRHHRRRFLGSTLVQHFLKSAHK